MCFKASVVDLSSSKMASVEALNCFFKLFEVFGIQYFSFKDLESKFGLKKPEKFHKIQFGFALVLFSSAMGSFVSATLKIDEIKINAKNGFNIFIKVFMNFGLIATIFSAIVESYLKTSQLKEIYMNMKKIELMSLTHFDHEINYKKFKKSWIKKFFTISTLFSISYLLIARASLNEGKKLLPYLIGYFPIFAFGLIVFKFTFHIDLVNVQLENLLKMMSKEVFIKVNSTNLVTIRHVLQSRSLAFRKIYNVIYDTAEIVNNFLAISALFILINLIVVSINTGFQCILAATENIPASKKARESFQSF